MTYIEFKENELKHFEGMLDFLTRHAVGLNDEMNNSISEDILRYTNLCNATKDCLSRLQKSL